MSPTSSVSVLALLVMLATACGDDLRDPSAATASGTSAATSGTSATTDESGDAPRGALYHEDVRPILAAHCGTCHTAGAVAPFTLEDYAQARAWGEAILAAVQARSMPPFAVDNSGSCNTFIDDGYWLDEEEIDILGEWVEAGYPEGDASLPAPPAPEPATLSGSVVALSLPEYTPASADGGSEDYHCFLVELDLDAPRYMTGFDVRAGDPRMVHHVLGFRVDPGFFGNRETMQALDDQSPNVPGWECFGAAGEDVFPGGVPVTWAPGVGAIAYPQGVGVRFDPGDVLVVQVHYDLAQGGGTDETVVHLALADQVEREAFQLLWDPFLFSAQLGPDPYELPPGQQATQFSWDDTLRDMMSFNASAVQLEQVEILGLIPHMHQRGRRMSIALETPAGMECAAEVDRWDFDWQRGYFFEEPLQATLDDSLHVTCEWSTEGEVGPVLPGFGTGDEMCLVGLMLAPIP